ncbi:MAG: DUF4180 domain-containing protein [Herpetosiphonaceae bacterium]|nr:DUF4180 domain-containing protein [Herpetosiphonaceae bacterium]
MDLLVHEVDGQRFLEGTPGQQFIERIDDVSFVLGECFGNTAHGLLLYPENLTVHFFDLSSGEAGAILQKLRTYHVRLAIVRSHTLKLSRLFGEVIADEQRGSDFRLFDERSAAEAWLGGESGTARHGG